VNRLVFFFAMLSALIGTSATRGAQQPSSILLTEPRWSPDGKSLMFAARLDRDLDVFVASSDGSSLRRIACSDSSDYIADWSPDGRRVAFTSTRDGRSAVYVTELGTGAVGRVSPPGADASQGTWSPDGRRIAFRAFDDPGNSRISNIWTVSVDGTDARALTRGQNRFEGPAWSPDGSRLLVTANVDRTTAFLHTLPLDGSSSTAITTARSGSAHGGSWSPDGRQIAFYSQVSGNSEVYVMNADGTGIRNLTNHPSRDFVSHWTSDGKAEVIWSNRDPAGGTATARQQSFYELNVADGNTRRIALTDRLELSHSSCTEQRR
jgi:TolB protein